MPKFTLWGPLEIGRYVAQHEEAAQDSPHDDFWPDPLKQWDGPDQTMFTVEVLA